MPEAHAHPFRDMVSVVTGVAKAEALKPLHQGEGMNESTTGRIASGNSFKYKKMKSWKWRSRTTEAYGQDVSH